MECSLPLNAPYAKELTVALNMTRVASKLSLLASPGGSVAKDDLSPVTVVDIAIQALLTCTLRQAFPSDVFIGEESSQQLREDQSLKDQVWKFMNEMKTRCESLAGGSAMSFPREDEKRRRAWVMDPIDGTKAFMVGGLFAINVALLDAKARQALCVAGCPKLDPRVVGTGEFVSNTDTGAGAVLFAVRGYGTYIQEFVPGAENGAMLPARKFEQLSVAEPFNPSELRWADSPSIPNLGVLSAAQRRTAEILGVQDATGQVGYRSCDIHASVMRWAFLALGNINSRVHIWNQRGKHGCLWDYAGAMLLFEEVGGKITDLEGMPIDLSTGRMLDAHGSIICGPAKVHSEILRAARKAVVEIGRGDLLDM